jgi:hypothetical protein
MQKTQRGDVLKIINGFAAALREYPIWTNGFLFPRQSESFPKYPLLRPAVASAIPSSMPISATEKPMLVRYIGITG